MPGLFDDLVPTTQPSDIPQITVSPARPNYTETINTAATQYGIDPGLLTNLLRRESALNPSAVSPKGAVGIAQFMPGTAKELGIDPRNPEQSIFGAAKYLAQNRDRFGGDMTKALAAYNWGPGNVSKWSGDPAALPAETRNYVQALMPTGSSAQAAPAAPPAQPSGMFDDLVPQQQKGPKVSRVQALTEGVLGGLSANFRDEIIGAAKASGLPETVGGIALGGLAAPVGAARLGYEALTGEGEATRAYNEAVARQRAFQEAARQQYPGTMLTGELAGSVMLPGGAALQGATLPARMLRGAAVGGLYGGAAGAGGGTDLPSRAAGGAAGTVAGGIIGGVAPPVVEGILQGGRAVIGPTITGVRGAFNPAQEAARRTATYMGRDIAADPTAAARLTAQEFAGTPGARIMDIGGETIRGAARSAANTSPEARTVLNQVINERFDEQAPRIVTWLRDTFNFPNAAAQQEAIRQTSQLVNTPAYATAMRDGAGGVWNAELQRLAGAPEIRRAAQAAMPSLANRGISEGFTAPRQIPLQWDRQSGLASPSVTANGNQRIPDLRFWDQVKRQMDGQIGKAVRSGDATRVNELTGLKNALVDQLDQAVPSYATARAGAAHFFGARDALNAGEEFVRSSMANTEARRHLAQMTAQERQLFQDGFVSRLIQDIERLPDRRNVVNSIYASPQARERIDMVMGRQRAGELEAMLRVEGLMDFARGAIQGNSTTARQWIERGLAGGAGASGAYGLFQQDPQTLTISAIMGALAAGGRHIDQRVARQVAELLVSRDRQQLLRGIAVVARNNRFMDGLRLADRKIASMGGQQAAGRTPVAAMPTIGRAEDQPEVPGPPTQ